MVNQSLLSDKNNGKGIVGMIKSGQAEGPLLYQVGQPVPKIPSKPCESPVQSKKSPAMMKLKHSKEVTTREASKGKTGSIIEEIMHPVFSKVSEPEKKKSIQLENRVESTLTQHTHQSKLQKVDVRSPYPSPPRL